MQWTGGREAREEATTASLGERGWQLGPGRWREEGEQWKDSGYMLEEDLPIDLLWKEEEGSAETCPPSLTSCVLPGPANVICENSAK